MTERGPAAIWGGWWFWEPPAGKTREVIAMTDEKLTRFLGLIPNARWTQPPSVWGEQLRQALSDNLVAVGWGGVLKLTDAGRELAKPRYEIKSN